jgi:hypothetical protein
LPAVSIASEYETGPAKLWFAGAGAVGFGAVETAFAVSIIFAAALDIYRWPGAMTLATAVGTASM